MSGEAQGGARVISLRARRSDHDVTNTVQVTTWRPVWEAVHDIFVSLYDHQIPPGAADVAGTNARRFRRRHVPAPE